MKVCCKFGFGDLESFLKRIWGVPCGCPTPRLGLVVTQVYGKRVNIMEHPKVTMFDVEKVLLSVTAVGPDGAVNTTVPIDWAGSDTSQVSTEPVLDANGQATSCFALTPLNFGSAVITCKARGFTPETVEIEYLQFVPGALNLSVGTPQPDTEG